MIQHLLVHTGEKGEAYRFENNRSFELTSTITAHVCDTCGRRFGVQSNLNRHAKRCALRPVNSTKALAGTSSAGVSPSEQPAQQEEIRADLPVEIPRGRKRKSVAQDPTADDTPTETTVGRPKRSRRAPSPCRWVPDSLRSFDLTPQTKSTPVPLPPVQPFGDSEERDSLDENVAVAPYHPLGWKGILPGPGVMERDIANTSGGRILVF